MMPRVQHVVLFKFPRELTADEERWMFEIVGSWPKEIAGFTRLRLGKDVGGRSGGFDYLLLTEFESEEAMQAYFPHHRHAEFAKWIAEMRTEIVRNDYVLDGSTSLLET
jgi:heme-degrading monooxygenase HmoA